MKVVSDKAIRVATTNGAVVLFEPGQVIEISETIGLLALQQGAKQVEGEAPVEVPTLSEEETLVQKLVDLMNEGDPSNFKKDNTPKATVVNELAGRTLSSEEREAAWEAALRS